MRGVNSGLAASRSQLTGLTKEELLQLVLRLQIHINSNAKPASDKPFQLVVDTQTYDLAINDVGDNTNNVPNIPAVMKGGDIVNIVPYQKPCGKYFDHNEVMKLDKSVDYMHPLI